MSFNPELIKKARLYFSKRFKDKISPDEASEYLNSLADLYLVFSNLDNEVIKKGGTFPVPFGDGESSDLISPHNCKE